MRDWLSALPLESPLTFRVWTPHRVCPQPALRPSPGHPEGSAVGAGHCGAREAPVCGGGDTVFSGSARLGTQAAEALRAAHENLKE